MCAFSSLCSEITTYFVETLSNVFSMKTLRTIHEVCMINLPYHNEHVKNFSTQIFTAVMGNRGDKGLQPTFLVFSFRAKFGPRYLTNLLIFAIKFSKVKGNFISNNSSKYVQKYQDIKPWRGLKIFENLLQELEKVNFGGP